MIRYVAIICIVTLLAGCREHEKATDDRPVNSEKAWQSWHSSKRAVEAKVDALTNAPDGQDCPAIIAVYQQSGWPQDIIDLDAGATIVSCHAEAHVARRPLQSMSEGFELMEHAALSKGEGGVSAPQKLRLWFERGAGQAPHYAIAPVPELAACWMQVETDSYDGRIDNRSQVDACIAMRKKLTARK